MRKFTLISLFMLIGLHVMAKDVTQSQAMQIAQSFLHQQTSAKKSAGREITPSLQLAYTAKAQNGDNCFYVFNANANNGFIIVSAEDQTQEILGYSDSGNFDQANMPENMRNWLSSYADQIKYVRTHNLAKKQTVQYSYKYNKVVKPLLGDIQWNQDAPYNDLCPSFDISSRCATGCVATAMAQVMYYNRWPETGIGSHTYAPSIMDGRALTADFGNTHYAWDKMLPKYDNNSSDESREAVAQLMLHCGISVDMQYSSSSGAASMPVPIALATYFGYDKGVAYRTRQNYSTEEWQNIIIDELNHGRAMLAMGRSSAGGHAFVFDGYDTNGLVHVNWGWGGMSNGYFRTTALAPASQGIGGAEGGFNYNQYLITGIQRPTGCSEEDVEMVSSEGLVAAHQHIAKGDKTNIKLHGLLYNAGWKDATVYFGLALLDEKGDTVKVISNDEPDDVQIGYSYNGLTFENVDLGTLADGNYRLYPVSRAKDATGIWHRVRDEYIGYPNYVNIHAENNQVTFIEPDYFCLNAKDVELAPEIYSGVMTEVSANIVNEGDVDYLGEVNVAILDKKTGRTVATGSKTKIDLQPNANIQLSFNDAYKLEPGDYLLTIIDDDDRHICNSKEITILAAPGVTSIEPAEQLAFADNQHVDKANVEITAKIKCTEGAFGGYAYLFILNESGSAQKGCLDPQFFQVKAGETTDVHFKGPFENGIDGNTYMATILIYDGANYSVLAPRDKATCLFTLGKQATSIDAILSDGGSQTAVIYDINGVRIPNADMSTLPRGIYIVKTVSKTFKFTK